jgi:alpha-beta hydrolase superfamily lysophospholipase
MVDADEPGLAPEEVWATAEGVSLRMVAYEGPGAGGPSIVVCHGLVTSTDALRSVVPGLDPYARLAGEGFNVLALDWPGHGRSGGLRGHLTYRAAMEASSVATAHAVQRWGGPVGLFGTAMGGVLAFYSALESDGLGAVACHNVLDLRDIRPVLGRTRQGALLPAAAALHARVGPERLSRVRIPASAVVATPDLAADPSLARALRHHPEAVRSYTLAGLASILLTPQDKPDIAAQRVPTFVAVGSGDRVLAETPTRAFVSRLPVDTQLWVLPGGGHQLVLEHPRALVPAVGEFFRRHLR